jgi:Protein of unknown function (DUF1569)
MKSIFDQQSRNEVIDRINSLTVNSKPLWGQMTVGQMVRHCSLCEAYYYGNIKVNRSFLGRIFGKMAIKSILKENAAFRKNSPTPPSLKVTGDINNLEIEKENWKKLIERYGLFGDADFNHWFFGKMTNSQVGQFIYKHCDHHLKQFGI